MKPPTLIGGLARFVTDPARAEIPEAAMEQARQCLADWFGVCLGASRMPEAIAFGRALGSQPRYEDGPATLLTGGRGSAPAAALVNGALSHILDFDDTHVPSILHGSGPLWAALLAVGEAARLPERRLLAAFVVGFQVGARLGDRGLGERLTRQGWHATPVLGRIAAAAALSHARRFDADAAAHAMALAASQATGFTRSFGTMAKPLNAGRAANEAVLAADLAHASIEGPLGILDGPDGLMQTLLQDRDLSLDIAAADLFPPPWEVGRNSFKPYASCQLTHAAIDAARKLSARVDPARVRRVRAHAHPLALKIAGGAIASTPTEAKFSLRFCIALALSGHACSMKDFSADRLSDPALQALAGKVDLIPDPGATRTSARLEVVDDDGAEHDSVVEHAFGSIENPMQWEHLEKKFMELALDRLPVAETRALFNHLAHFDEPGALDRAMAIARSGT